jgi:hypothetical protein
MTDQLDNEAYQEDQDNYEEDYDEEYEGDSFRKWGIVAAIGAVVVCIGLVVVLWFGREVFMAPFANMIASATPTATNTLPPTATFTQIPTATETQLPTDTPPAAPPRQPAPEIMALAIPPPALEENFADNSRAWTAMGENSEFLIQENRLILRSNQPGQQGAVYCAGDCGPFKDSYYYEAELLDEQGSQFGYGLLFAINEQRNAYYAYKVRPGTGEYGLFKLVNGSWTALIDWTKTPALLPAPQTNILGASLQEKNINLYLNGALLAGYKDENPYNEGRLGFMVDQDGVRLFAGNVLVYQLSQATPVPPGQLTPGAPAGQPTFTPGFPTPATKFTPTPTKSGSCPTGTPEDTWILVVTNVNLAKTEISINGVRTKIQDLNTAFYLSLNTDYTIVAGNKTYEYNFSECKIVYIKVK